MPLLGYMLGALFADMITAYDHWIAFGLLCFLGGKMIIGSFKKERESGRESPVHMCADRKCPDEKHPDSQVTSLRPVQMLPLALATSIDALAVGVSFAFLQVEIVSAVLFIGIVTFAISMAGVKIGNVFGTKFKSKAEFAGGIILALIGTKILIEGLNITSGYL
jgi:putative Mn2+ efflux pump MntP